jgi:hypothetical protein
MPRITVKYVKTDPRNGNLIYRRRTPKALQGQVLAGEIVRVLGKTTQEAVVAHGSVAQIGREADLPFPRIDLSCDLCDGCAERGEAVEHRDPDLELCDLTVEVPCAQALA